MGDTQSDLEGLKEETKIKKAEESEAPEGGNRCPHLRQRLRANQYSSRHNASRTPHQFHGHTSTYTGPDHRRGLEIGGAKKKKNQNNFKEYRDDIRGVGRYRCQLDNLLKCGNRDMWLKVDRGSPHHRR